MTGMNWKNITDNLQHMLQFNPKEPLLFNTGLFLFLFFIFISFYQLVYKNSKTRIVYLTIFSWFFYYKCGGFFFLLLILSTVVDFQLAGWIYKSSQQWKRNLLLIVSLVVNLGLLAYFKYTNFFIDIVNAFQTHQFSHLQIILPVGISFYTFQVLSYTIDIYRRQLKPADSILDFAFYISFFPHLVAGPIVRAVNFLPQIHQPLKLSKAEFGEAVILIATGLFKKAVISDYISVNFVDRVFEEPHLYSGFENLMAVYGYAVQIYCDFSGYSDMAIGIALLLGYRLGINFNQPYQSSSITEFWRRWHISLSSWLRDYLYIPLGGNRNAVAASYIIPLVFFFGVFAVLLAQAMHTHIYMMVGIYTAACVLLLCLFLIRGKKELPTNLNLTSTMLLGGLWHGASWNFIAWGAMHGTALSLEKIWRDKVRIPKNAITKMLGVLITFHFVCLCWVFFRASDFVTATDMLHQITTSFHGAVALQWFAGYQFVAVLILFAMITHFISANGTAWYQKKIAQAPLMLQALVVMLVIWCVIQTKSSEVQPFIYFQF